MAMQCQLEAHMSHDEQYIREQFDKAYSLPEVTPEAAMARAGCLVKIARDMDWRARRRTRYEESAERLLALVQKGDYPQPMPTAMAHMCLAETHGSDGGIDAAWRHYCRAQEILANVTGLDPAFPPDEAVELAAGLLGVILDDNTGAPHDDIDQLVRRILVDVEQRLDGVDWSATQRDWVAIRLQAVKTLHAAVNGEQDTYYECLDTMQRLVDIYEPQLPSNVAYIVSLAPELKNFMLLQHVRMYGPEVGVYLSSTLTAPATPQHTPAPCHHFDPPSPRTPSPEPNTSDSEPPEERDEQSENRPTLEIDRARAVSRHGELLLRQERNNGVDDHITAQITAAVRSACSNPQEALDHLIGAWRLIDTMAHGLSRITGHTLAETRDSLDRELIRVHHDDNTDTVPARVALRCLNNNWWPELNDMLSGITHDVMAETLTTLLNAEHHLAAQYSTLQGREVVETIEHTIEAAVAFDSVSVHRVERTYDPATGTIAVARDMLGEESRICLHDPQAGGVEHVFILGDEQWGKSSSLRVVVLQAAISGVFCVFPADPRNEHNFPQLWQSFVGTPAWIATNVADTLRNLEAMSRIIDFRSAHTGFDFPVNGAPGILFALDDADDVLTHPRGRALIERIVVDGPRVCVGMAAVIRDLDSLTSNEHLLRAVTSTPNKMYFGASGSEVLQNLRSTPSP